MRLQDRRFTLVGVAFAIVGIVGYTVFGWRFGGDTGSGGLALAIVAIFLTLLSTSGDDD